MSIGYVIPDYEVIFNEILPEVLPDDIVKTIKDFTYNYEDVLRYHGYVICYDCGNVWDGNAQCPCWQEEWWYFNDNRFYDYDSHNDDSDHENDNDDENNK